MEELWALSSVEERPFRIREVEGSNPSVSTFFLGVWVEVARHCLSVAQLVEHVTVDVCDHRVAGSIPAAETLQRINNHCGEEKWRCRVSIPVPLAC